MRRTIPLCCALVLVVGACSSKSPTGVPTGTATARPSGSASPSASGTAKPRIPVARAAVYASGNTLFHYDASKDVLTEVARGQAIRSPKFVGPDEISFVQGTTNAVLRVINIKTRQVREVFSSPNGIDAYGWSPDRQVVAYISTDRQAYPHLNYRFLDNEGVVQPVATLARAFGRGGIASDQVKIQFSPSGDDVLVVYTPADGSESEDLSPEQSQLQVRTFNGELAFAADMEDGPTMATWSIDGLRVYYRIDQGARAWRADSGIVEGVRGGVRWFDPWPSQDGRYLAYDTGSDSTGVRVGVVDLRAGTRKTVSRSGRASPVFATAKIVWVQGVRACTECPGATEYTTGVYALDITKGTEKRLALRSLQDIDVLYR